jgi:hypothetical protein
LGLVRRFDFAKPRRRRPPAVRAEHLDAAFVPHVRLPLREPPQTEPFVVLAARLADQIGKNLPLTDDATFEFTVKVDWRTGADAAAMINDIISEGEAMGLITTPARHYDVIGPLRDAADKTKAKGNFTLNEDIGPDIYFV